MTADLEAPAATDNQGDFERDYWRSAPPVGERLGDLESADLSTDEFRLLADNIPTLCWVANGDGYIVWYNRRWHEYCGTTAEQMEGWGWQSVHDPEVLPVVMERWTKSIATGQPFEMTFPLRGADGVFRPFLTRVQPVRDASGNIARWFGVNTEISIQSSAEAALRESKERYRTLFEAMDAGFCIIEMKFDEAKRPIDYRFLEVNPAFETHTGLADAAGRWMRELAPEHEQHWFDTYGRVALDRKPDRFENTAAALGRWFDVYAFPVGAAEEHRVGLLFNDISERKRAEEALRESEAQMRLIADALPVLISYVDAQQRYQFNNKAYEQWFGHPRETMVGRPLREVLGEAAYRQIQPKAEAALAGERQSFDAELDYRDGGVRHVHVEYVPHAREDGTVAGFYALVQDISDRHQADLALRESEQRFRAMADSAPMPAWVTNEQGIEFANRALADFAGMDPEALLGETWTRLLHPDDLQRVSAIRSAAWATQESYQFEAPFRRADGQWRLLQVSSRPRFDGQGKLLGYVGMAVDLTEMRRAEQELRKSEARYRDVFENAAVGMIEIDADWNILISNDAYREITGRSDEDLRGANCLSFTHRDDVATGADALQALAAGEIGRAVFEKRYLRPDGQIIWVRSSLSRVSGEQSDNHFLKVVEDITEIRNAREALREESQALEILNRTAGQVAAELDLDRLVQTVVDAGVELTGAQFGAFFYNVIEERGESYMLYALSGAPREAFSKYPMPRNTQIFAPTFSGEGTVRSDDITKDPRYGKSEPYYGMPEGHLPVRSYLAEPVVSRSGEVIGGLFFGHEKVGVFTERAERLMKGLAAQAAIGIDNARLFQASQNLNQTLEQRVTEEVARRSEAEERLRQAQKMETVGQLTGGLAHDFNNLLQIVTGNLDILLRNLPADTPRLRRSAENAMRGAERASTLTQRLLAFSRRQPLSPKPIDPNKLVAGMEELLHRTLGETIAIETVLSPGLWRIEADPNQLENTILNLAVNARDAMPDGGKLTIETSNAHLDEAYVAQNAEVWAGQYVVICVSDTGVGMPEETLVRVFEPFFTTKEVGKGTGLGLSMVYGFVKQSGGHVKIYSEVGEGTSVKIYLPRLLGSHDEVEEAQDTLVPEGTREETILVCEDDDDVRAYSVEVLRELGYRVLEAHDGRAALHLIERQEERIDLLFTDVVLPGGMTGAVLAEEARKVRPELKVLFTTGYARNAIVHHGRLDPGVELITKPFSFADLAARVRDLLDARPVS